MLEALQHDKRTCTHCNPLCVYVARFYRDGKLIHSQRGTLPEIAILCHTSRLVAYLGANYGDGDGEGRMYPDGRVEWFD